MKNQLSRFHVPISILAFILPLLLPFYTSADLLKKVGGILPEKNKSSPSISSPPSHDLTTLFSRPEFYYQRPRYFDSVGFDVGDYIIVEPLDKKNFNALYVPSYKGLPRLSLTPEYKQLKINYSANGSTIKNYRNAVVERFQNDMLIYHNLRLLDLMSQYVTEDKLKIDNSGKAQNSSKHFRDLYMFKGKTRPSDRYFYQYVPRYHIESLVSTLRPATHQHYLGDPDDSRASSSFSRQMISWGGTKNNNEFKARRAYFEYVEKIVPKLKAWAQSLPDESYIVGTVTLGEYDFKRKGFNLSLFPPQGTGSKKIFFYAPRAPSKRVFIDGNNDDGKHHLFFPIGASNAEMLQERIKQPHDQLSQLYFAVKGEVYSPQYARLRRHGPTYAGVNLAYDVTGSTIEFFADELLKNKVFEAKIQ